MNEIHANIGFIILNIEKYLLSDDLDLVYEFLTHNKTGLAVEFICDKLDEYNAVLPESLGRKIQVVAGRLGLDAAKSWERLIVLDEYLRQPKRLLRDCPNFSSAISNIYNDLKINFTEKDRNQIEEYIEVDEYELAMDHICACLTQDKIPISKEILDKIRIVFFDLDLDPNGWSGFILKSG